MASTTDGDIEITPIWTDKDRELYREVKEAKKAGKLTFKTIE